MITLLVGADLKSKDAKIQQMKANAFADPKAMHFDFELLDGIGLPADVLKKSLLTLPAMSPRRLVVVRNIQKLSAADAQTLCAFAAKPAADVDLILETSDDELKGPLKGLAALCTVAAFGIGQQGNVFDMTRLMAAGRTKDALKLLQHFYVSGTHPLQIMGGLVWFWGREGRKLDKPYFERGLKALEDADLNIKRSRIEPEYAVEKVVVELTGLLSSR